MRLLLSMFTGSFLLCSTVLDERGIAQTSKDGPPVFPVESDRVAVDFIVRDKKGAPLHGLSAGDVEVFEDGERQVIESLEWIARSRGPLTPAAGRVVAASTVGSAGDDNVARSSSGAPYVALVFDRLGPSGRALASKTAASWIGSDTRSQWTGVFLIDQGIRTLQPFTLDGLAARHAAEVASSIVSTPHTVSKDRERIRELRSILTPTPDSGVLGADSSGGPSFSRPSSVDSVKAGLELRMLEASLAIDANEQGRGTLGGLLSLVNAITPIPGRKTAVLFSEGLSLPTDVDPLFQSLIAAANRANVSFYTLDAVGLRTRSGNEEMRRELLAQRPPDWTAENGGGGSLGGLERNEGLLRLAPGSGLGRLALETGGLLTEDTNALMAGLKQVDEDLAGYYLLTYVPTNTTYDGRFRSIELRVRVPHGTIQGRKGYLAIRSKSPTPVLTYEAPAIAALERGQSAPTIRVRATGLDVPMANGWSRVAVIVEVQGQDLRAELDQKKQLYLRDFTIVALVRDAYGRLIRKMGQHYLVSGPIDKLEEANKSSILFYREAELSAGVFAVSVAAWDAHQALAGAVRTEIRVAPAAGGSGDTRLGSIVVVRQAEPVRAGDAIADHVLRYGDVLLYPNLGEPVRVVPTGQLAFLVTAHSSGPLSAQMALFAGGLEKWHQGFSFPPPESDGIRRFVGTLPLGGIARGEYELRLTIPGSSLEPRRASLTLVDP